MLRRWPQRGRVILLVPVVCLFCAGLYGQSGVDNPAEFASATLPESNEALLLSSRIEEAIGAGDYRLAIEQIERLMRLPGGLVMAPATRTYYPVWRQAFRLLAQLPPAGVELYRQMYDAEVEARFREAVSQADIGALRELFRGYRLSSEWEGVGIELATRLLDDGAYGEAIEVMGEITATGAGFSRENRLQLAVSLGCGGARRAAALIVAELKDDSVVGQDPEWRERLHEVETWLELSGSEQRNGFSPAIGSGAVWFNPIAGGGVEQSSGGERDVAEAVGILRTLPSYQPLVGGVDDELLLVRMGGRLSAFDCESLLLKWSVTEQAAGRAGRGLAESGVAGERTDRPRLPVGVEDLMWDHIGQAVSVGFGQVYTVERLSGLETGGGVSERGGFRIGADAAVLNELVARELGSGRVLWRTGTDAADGLFDAVFENVPVALEEELAVPIRRGDDLLLAVLSPEEGKLLREVPLIGPPTRFSRRGGRCMLVDDATTLYVCTGNGVIAALAREDLRWKWATVYPSSLAEHLGQLWWQPLTTSAEPNVDVPIVVDDLLIVAPVDSGDVFALDRFDGRERWRLPRDEYPYVLGALAGVGGSSATGLVLGGREVVCVDPERPDPEQPKWRSVPLKITGRAAIGRGLVFIPTDEGIVVLDGQTGKVLGDQDAGGIAEEGGTGGPRELERDMSANLVVAGAALLSVSLERIVKYPDPERTQALYEGEAGAVGNAASRGLVLGWLAALEGRMDAALRGVAGLGEDDPVFVAARNQLLRYVYMGLARAASGAEERVGYLRQASTLADSPQAALELAVSIGEVLEASGDWGGAVRHYGGMLRESGGTLVADRGQAQRRVAGWLYAAERIAALSGRVGSEQTAELVDECLSEAQQRSLNLQRLHIALSSGVGDGRLERLLSLLKIAPELRAAYLPRGQGRDLPEVWRRRLCLERWDVNVSLGLLEAAARQREVWETQFSEPAVDAGGAEEIPEFARLTAAEESDRVYAIDLATRKLEQVTGRLFGERVARQWKIEQGELLVDSQRPLSAMRPWILASNLGDHRIELVNAYKYQNPQRQTEDGLNEVMERLAGSGVWAGRRFEWEGGPRETWPVVIYEHLAAVPVQGGLICVGLGPERYAGRRQWEYPVTAWTGVPVDFTERAFAGEHGVYFCPRRDRVVLVGWFDGQLWWQRDLPGVIVERLYLADDKLVIVSNDKQVWVTDATFGRDWAPIATGAVPPRLVDVVGGMIVLWSDEGGRGVNVQTGREVWSRALEPAVATAVVPGRSWIAYRGGGSRQWYLLDARDGQTVFEAALGEFESISAIVAEAERVLVAGSVGELEEEEELQVVRLRAVARASGALLWSRDIETTVTTNPTQLAAHPDLIPVLVAGSDGAAARESQLPALVLINKRDGEVGAPLSIKDDYRPAAEASCAMYLLALPTRIIVQVGGNLIAYGNSPLRGGS